MDVYEWFSGMPKGIQRYTERHVPRKMTYMFYLSCLNSNEGSVNFMISDRELKPKSYPIRIQIKVILMIS